ncbi:amylopullulanase [Thermococcus profundus]|uniref:Amylopullulanase n=1 Tax=Thermococcus profundus TaxID=49899 RepID=A0A2Z2MBQ2_THEPR|nr:glucodextranase DOMON-like domain-containing protein [Thermococcus profundus]ASJ02933.1 amylopullulanase [Thermococcus profundus]
MRRFALLISLFVLFGVFGSAMVSATTVAVDLSHGENTRYLVDPVLDRENKSRIVAPSIVDAIGDVKWAYFGDPSLLPADKIQNLGDSITQEGLENVDILILGQPREPLTQDEIQAIKEWFLEGGKVLWVAGDSDFGSGNRTQSAVNALLREISSLRVDLCSVDDPVSNTGKPFSLVAYVSPDDGIPFKGLLTQNFVYGGKVLFHGPGPLAWVDANGTWHPLTDGSMPENTYRIVVTSENGTIVENNDQPANAYTADDTGVFTLMAAQIVQLDSGKRSVLIVSGESPYGDYEPIWSPLAWGTKLDGPQFVSNVIHWAAFVAAKGAPERLFSLSDPVGDDNGPGTYTYPTDLAFNGSGLFDITGLDVERAGNDYVFSFHFKNLGGNPWGAPNGFSLQIIEAYFDFKDGGNTSTIGPGPNVRLDPDHPWDVSLRITGWGSDLFLPNGTVIEDLQTFTDGESNTVSVTVPAKYIGDLKVEGPKFPRIAVLVGSQDGFGVDQWRDVGANADQWVIGGADPAAVEAGVAPRVMDLLVPDWFIESQEEQLKSYNVSSKSLAVVRLVPLVQTGYLTITSEPSGANVIIDGFNVGKTPVENLALPLGLHVVKLQLSGYMTEEFNVSITPGSLSIPITLTPKTGMLTVTSNPSGATVLIDGKEVGKTPIEEYRLPVGTHEVTVKMDGYREESFNVSILENKELTFNVELVPLESTTTTTTTTTITTTSTTTTTSPGKTTTTSKPTTTTTTTTSSKKGGGGICGPAALIGLAIMPLLLRRKE